MFFMYDKAFFSQCPVPAPSGVLKLNLYVSGTIVSCVKTNINNALTEPNHKFSPYTGLIYHFAWLTQINLGMYNIQRLLFIYLPAINYWYVLRHCLHRHMLKVLILICIHISLTKHTRIWQWIQKFNLESSLKWVLYVHLRNYCFGRRLKSLKNSSVLHVCGNFFKLNDKNHPSPSWERFQLERNCCFAKLIFSITFLTAC